MQFRPRFYQPFLTLRQTSSDEPHRIDAVNLNMLVIVSMEVRQAVGRAGLGKHANMERSRRIPEVH